MTRNTCVMLWWPSFLIVYFDQGQEGGPTLSLNIQCGIFLEKKLSKLENLDPHADGWLPHLGPPMTTIVHYLNMAHLMCIFYRIFNISNAFSKALHSFHAQRETKSEFSSRKINYWACSFIEKSIKMHLSCVTSVCKLHWCVNRIKWMDYGSTLAALCVESTFYSWVILTPCTCHQRAAPYSTPFKYEAYSFDHTS